MPCRSLVCDERVDDPWRLEFRRGGDTAWPPWADRRGIAFSLQSNGVIGAEFLSLGSESPKNMARKTRAAE